MGSVWGVRLSARLEARVAGLLVDDGGVHHEDVEGRRDELPARGMACGRPSVDVRTQRMVKQGQKSEH
jgi:hypothetical protein